MSLPDRQRSPEDAHGVPAPASDAIDALVEAVSAGARPAHGANADTEHRAAPPVVTLPPRAHRSWLHSRVTRWMPAALLAFSIGVGGTAWMLRTFESFSWSADTRARGAPPHTPANAEPAPARADHLASNELRPPAPFARALRPQAPGISREDATARAEALPRAEGGNLREVEGHVVVQMPSDDASKPAAGDATANTTDPALPVSSSTLPIDAALPAPLPNEPPAVVSSDTADATAAEEAAVLDTVEEYAQALEQLDVGATALLWPSVDRRALGRAFASLKSQEVEFEDCSVALADTSATARCQGTTQYVAKVGPSTPRTGRYEWLFKMRKRSDTWTIEGLSAWPLAASRDQQ